MTAGSKPIQGRFRVTGPLHRVDSYNVPKGNLQIAFANANCLKMGLESISRETNEYV